jgi:lipopolysaccharide transport system permease protein
MAQSEETAMSGDTKSWFLLRELVRRDFRSRYAGSLLGLVWSFLQPVWQLLLFSFVFAIVLRIPLTGEATERFWAFLFAGLLPWLAIQEGISRGANAVTDNAPLVKKLRFPSELLVLTVVGSALIHQGIAAAAFALALGVTGELAPAGLPWLLVALPFQLALTTGLGLVLAALNVFLRDIAQAVGLALSAWFYLTPVVYPLALVPDRYRPWIEANPLTGLVSLYRAAFLGGTPAAIGSLAALALFAVGALGFGLWAFRRARPGFVDHL